MIEKSQIKADLEKAADLIDEKGHVQHSLTHDGKICMIQSLRLATGYIENPFDDNNVERRAAAEQAVEAVILTDICSWNNEDGRTGADVSAKLREVASGL